MGTNYYHRTNTCPRCGRYDEQHIGKSSGGWSFSFQGTDSIRSYSDWLQILEGNGKIFTEYGEEVTLEDFKELVNYKSGGKNHAKLYPDDSWLDNEGHSFSSYEFS